MAYLQKAIMACVAVLLFFPASSLAETVTLRMPEYSDGQSDYYHELISTALHEAGHAPIIERFTDFPHLRERTMLERGDLDVLWLVRSEKRDKTYIPIPVPLTNGLIGKRFLLITDDQRDHYREVESLGDFRRLGKVGAFGKNWFDVGVWEANYLPYKEVADWRLIYRMLQDGDREVDYFSRGFTEIVHEHEANPELVIEPHLMLVYDRDYIFYVNPYRPDKAIIVEAAMRKARDSGLIDRLIKKHWADSFGILKPESRTAIKLRLPR